MITKVTLRSATLHCFRLDFCTVVRILKLVLLYPIQALSSLSTEVLRDFFFPSNHFSDEWSPAEDQFCLSWECPTTSWLAAEKRGLRCIELPTGFSCVSWRLLPVTVLLQQLEVMQDVDASIEHTLMWKLVLINPTACYWSAKFIRFVVPLCKEKRLHNLPFQPHLLCFNHA